MRRVFAILVAIGLVTPAQSATSFEPEVPSSEAVMRWMKEYRAKPDPRTMPPMIRALSQRGGFKDPEASGLYVGFIAGVLGANPRGAKTLIAATLPLPFEDQWVLIRAVAYSGLPNWQDLLRDLAVRLPDRKLLVDLYLTGKLPTLNKVKLEPDKPKPFEKVNRIFMKETYVGGSKKEVRRELTFATSPELIDTYWGLYFATGMSGPVDRSSFCCPGPPSATMSKS